MAFRKPKPLGPTVTYSDFTTSFARNAVSNDVIRLTDINAVKRSIKNLVVTVLCNYRIYYGSSARHRNSRVYSKQD